MATNKPVGDGRRIGAVRGRSQVLNPNGSQWTKRNRSDGRFMDLKEDQRPFKGVRRESPGTRTH